MSEDPKTPPNTPASTSAISTVVPPVALTPNQAIIAALATAIISALTTSGGLTFLSGSTPNDVTVEVSELRGDMKSLQEKIDDIYDIVDKAHPRTP